MSYNDLFEMMDTMFSEPAKYSVPQFPPCEVRKNEDGSVRIDMAIAGYKKEDIEITADENRIVIHTVKDFKPTEVKGQLLSTSRIKRSSFESVFGIPETKFNLEEISAKFEDGILTISVPPKNKKEYKTIKID
jgi:HSP20 family molecular chaperone IbpA